MSTVADNLMALHGIKADLFAATREKGLDTTGRTLENLHELWGGISGGGALQAKTAVPSNVDVEVTPDDGYDALSAVTIAAALNLNPWNIRKGKTLFGVTGTADIAVTTEVPSDIPVSKDDADTAYEEAVGSAPKDEDGNDLDMMTLADDNGNITYGYFLQGAANGSANGTCLYNGVELPALPELSSYPYRVILWNDAASTYCYVGNKEPFSLTADNKITNVDTDIVYRLVDGAWKWTGIANDDYAPIWTNTDLYAEDGTVYLAASDPIPLDYNTIIRFDGNTEGFATMDMGNGIIMVKVSDSIITADQLRNCVIGQTNLDDASQTNGLVVADIISSGLFRVEEYADLGIVELVSNYWPYVYGISDAASVAEFGGETGTYILANCGGLFRVHLLAYNPASPSGFTITHYDPATTDFSAVGWRRMSYHTTGELAGQWTYDDFSTTASSGGNFLKNIIQCSREKLYYNGTEVWPNPDQSAITAEEVTT